MSAIGPFIQRMDAYREIEAQLPYTMHLKKQRVDDALFAKLKKSLGMHMTVHSICFHNPEHQHMYVVNTEACWRKTDRRQLRVRDMETVTFVTLLVGSKKVWKVTGPDL